MKTFIAALLLVSATGLACSSPIRASSSTPALESAAPSHRVIVTVDCGELHRVDTRWEVATTILKSDGANCTSYINVPEDSTASEIAVSIALAIGAVCEVDAQVLPNSEISRVIELTSATFGDIQLRKFGTELVKSPEGDLRVYHKNPVPIDDHFTIKKVPSSARR